jgi:hypothetical protein
MSVDLKIDRLSFISGRLYQVFNEITNSPQTITGVQKLAQMVEKILLTTPGTDLRNPDSGGGILSLIGTNIDPANIQPVFAQIQQGVGQVLSEFQKNQEGVELPLDEQLESLDLISVDFENNEDLNISILVTSKAGRQIVTVLP